MIKDLSKEVLKEQKKQTKLLQDIKLLLKQQQEPTDALLKKSEDKALEHVDIIFD